MYKLASTKNWRSKSPGHFLDPFLGVIFVTQQKNRQDLESVFQKTIMYDETKLLDEYCIVVMNLYNLGDCNRLSSFEIVNRWRPIRLPFIRPRIM
jgi:hypothetical protein